MFIIFGYKFLVLSTKYGDEVCSKQCKRQGHFEEAKVKFTPKKLVAATKLTVHYDILVHTKR